VSGYGLDNRSIEVRYPVEARGFFLTSVSRPALGPIQPRVQWVPVVLFPGVKRDRGMTLTTHPLVVPRSEWVGAILLSPLCLHRCVSRLLFGLLIYIYIYTHLSVSIFLTVYPSFAFKEYTGTSKFPFRALTVQLQRSGRSRSFIGRTSWT
jgi:hypothetical protein